MSESYKRWIYHATKEPKIINSKEFDGYEAMGWADTPAKFVSAKDFGVDPDNEIMAQQLGDAIEGVKEALNGALNIDSMGKKDLERYARKHFDVELDRRKGIKSLRKIVKELVGV